MQHTEDQARTKFCPLKHPGTVYITTEAVKNGISSSGDVNNLNACQSSDCMMWQWNERRDLDYRTEDEYVEEEHRQHDIPRTGYCGLARGKESGL